MSNSRPILTGALILTFTGIASRIIGFFYRIFLSHTIGAEGMGIYQMIFPIYTLCFTLCAAGLQTALSRTIAAREAQGDKKGAFDTFLAGLLLSLAASLAAAFALYRFSGYAAVHILHEPRCAQLLGVLPFAVPLAALHSCVSAYYYARKKTGVPSFCQLLEQFVRVASSYLIFTVMTAGGASPSPMIAVGGMLAGECASALVSLIAVQLEFSRNGYRMRSLSRPFAHIRELLTLSAPLAANRLMLNLLNSSEAVLIPARLKASGMASSEALSIYGVFTGMALPMILFPGAITHSVSAMLLPTVAQDQAAGRTAKISATIERTIQYCLLLGIFFLGVFAFHGKDLGRYVFSSTQAGTFLTILAFICPFLYLNSTLASILNGLGKTSLCFVQNLLGLLVRLAFVQFAVPVLGIRGYLYGILCSELFVTLLCLAFLYRQVPFSFNAVDAIIKPCAVMALVTGCGLFFAQIADAFSHVPPLLVLAAELLAMAGLYLVFLMLFGMLGLPRRKERNA